jgi:hypothetical protein
MLSKIESELNARIGKKCKLFNGESTKRWYNFQPFQCILEVCYALIGINKFVIDNGVLENYRDELIHLENVDLNFNFEYQEIEIESNQIINQNSIIEQQKENQENFINSLLEEYDIESDEEYYTQENNNNNL